MGRMAHPASTAIQEMQENPGLVPDASRMLWISHNLERCGDRATNIAEQVVFMLDAEVIELDQEAGPCVRHPPDSVQGVW